MVHIAPGQIHKGPQTNAGPNADLRSEAFGRDALYAPPLPEFTPKPVTGLIQVGDISVLTTRVNVTSSTPGSAGIDGHPVFTVEIRGPSAERQGFLAGLFGRRQEEITLQFNVGSEQCPDEAHARKCIQAMVLGLQLEGGISAGFKKAVEATMPIAPAAAEFALAL